MLTSDREKLWNDFLEKYEAEFKAYLGYGKEDIEKIGINDFFDIMGWENEDHLKSFKTDKMHIIPCIECRSKFAVFEEGYGLCPECQKKYDLDEFSKFYNSVADEEGLKAANDLVSGFFASPEYRKLFAIKTPNTPEYALVKKASGTWRLIHLPNLLSLLRGNSEYKYQIVLHDQSLYSENDKTVFDNISTAENLAKKYPAFFMHEKDNMV